MRFNPEPPKDGPTLPHDASKPQEGAKGGMTLRAALKEVSKRLGIPEDIADDGFKTADDIGVGVGESFAPVLPGMEEELIEKMMPVMKDVIENGPNLTNQMLTTCYFMKYVDFSAKRN